MSHNTFFKISKCLHLADLSKQKKQEETGYDPLYKIRPLIDTVKDTFDRYYRPGCELVIDEMMVGTHYHKLFYSISLKSPPSGE